MVEVAERQWGVISRSQLLECGISGARIARWLADNRLARIHQGVYALGHRSISVDGRVRAALLYAGSRAALSHTTAAWWWQLLPHMPRRIHVSGGRRSSVPQIAVHRPRRAETTSHRGLPVTTVARTLLDLGAMLPFHTLRRAVAEAEYRRLLDLEELESVLGRGRPGSARLRRALERHLPELARTLSQLEVRFLELCERFDLPIPEVNVQVEGFKVDAWWRDRHLIVELDSRDAHGTGAAVERDRGRDLALRAAGYLVLRYTWLQVTTKPELVSADLRKALSGEPLG